MLPTVGVWVSLIIAYSNGSTKRDKLRENKVQEEAKGKE